MTAASDSLVGSSSSIGTVAFLPLSDLHAWGVGRLAGDDMIAGGYEGLRLVAGFVRVLRPGKPILGLWESRVRQGRHGSPLLQDMMVGGVEEYFHCRTPPPCAACSGSLYALNSCWDDRTL